MKTRLVFFCAFLLLSAIVFGQKWSINAGVVGSMPEEDAETERPLFKNMSEKSKLGLRFGTAYNFKNLGRNKLLVELNYLQTGFRRHSSFPVSASEFDAYKLTVNNIELDFIWLNRLNSNKKNPFFLEFGITEGVAFSQKLAYFKNGKKKNSMKTNEVQSIYFAPLLGFSYSKIKNWSWFLRSTASLNGNVLFEEFFNGPSFGNDGFFGYFTLQTGIRTTLPPKKAHD
jgi:hypothetical protein